MEIEYELQQMELNEDSIVLIYVDEQYLDPSCADELSYLTGSVSELVDATVIVLPKSMEMTAVDKQDLISFINNLSEIDEEDETMDVDLTEMFD